MMNRIAWTVTIGGMGLCLLALSWPAHIADAPRARELRSGTSVTLALKGVPWWVKARLNGPEAQELPLQRRWNRVELLIPGQIREGPGSLVVEVGGLRPQRWECPLVIDNTPPPLALITPAADTAVQGETVEVVGEAEGRFRFSMPLVPGWNLLKFSAHDRAGNASRVERRVFSDRQAPALSLERLLPDGDSEPLRGKDSPKDSFRVRVLVRDDSGVERLRYRLDGGKWIESLLSHKEGLWQSVFPLRGLAEGARRLEFEARDRAGRSTREEAEFTIDSSEVLGEKMITRGARGEDVYQLQSRLHEAGVLGQANIQGFFDEVTEKAVKAFQRQEGLPETGRVGSQTLVALGPRIFVNLAAFELVLDRPGQELRRYSVACGQPAWPTPTGRFKVFDKVKDPSWIPPDSPWAREAQTIPPGPSNPLGTRWIGLDWGGVGIHGTNADWSIGSASSHGCLRMHISDVEELYELLAEGTPVTIYGGWEKEKPLKRYWP